MIFYFLFLKGIYSGTGMSLLSLDYFEDTKYLPADENGSRIGTMFNSSNPTKEIK